MKTVIFDGKEFSKKILTEVKTDITDITEKLGRRPKMVTIYNPGDKASRVYTQIKEKKAVELGIDFEKLSVDQLSVDQLSQKVKELNSHKTVDGVMIQMPLLGIRNSDLEIAGAITPGKDVDGLNPGSGVMPATVRAVLKILNYVTTTLSDPPPNLGGGRGVVLVVGNKGLVGERLFSHLTNLSFSHLWGMDKEDWDPEKIKTADVVISCTGQAGLIKPEMVKEGVICIDVGYPTGDFEPDVAQKAAFFTPVPGGVGPVTVAMLFANLVDLIRNKL